jgi:hypothetical protein
MIQYSVIYYLTDRCIDIFNKREKELPLPNDVNMHIAALHFSAPF